MLQNTHARKLTYGLKSYADYKAQILENQLSGLLLKINDNEVWVRLIGTFNAYLNVTRTKVRSNRFHRINKLVIFLYL